MDDRLKANSQDGFAAAVAGVAGQNYLGDPAVAEGLVRDFLTTVFTVRASWNEGGDGAAAQAKLATLCQRYGAVFMGESPAYVAQPWNSPHRLGCYLRAAVADAGDFASPCEAYFHFLAVQALNAAIALEEGTLAEEVVKASMNEVVDDAVDVLLGRRAGMFHV